MTYRLAISAATFRVRLRDTIAKSTPLPPALMPAAWVPPLPSELPLAALPDVRPLDIEGGLALSSWLFRKRLAAFGAGDLEAVALYRSPFDPA